jgi:hypothetical protein
VSENGLTEKDFRELLTRVRKVYDPILEARGYTLEYILRWDEAEGNAFTSVGKEGKEVTFLFTGGLVRGRYMTKDGLLFAACHEMGHHLGGFPKEKILTWSSTEGEADYFANLQCMKEILKGDPENAKAKELKLPRNIRKKCAKIYSDEDSINICLRSTKAAEYAFRFLQAKDLGRNPDKSLFNHFLFPVDETIMRYPDHACRAETAYEGAVCNRFTEISDTDETVGFCHKRNGDRVGVRPRCWFKPSL